MQRWLAASQQFVWIRLYIAITVLWILQVPELIKALYAAGLAWLVLGISSHNCSVVNQQFSCYCHCHYLQEQGTVKS